MDKNDAVKTAEALKGAARRIVKLESEGEMLRKKVAELENKAKEQEKKAHAMKLAMDMHLDEDAKREVMAKMAKLQNDG